MISRKSKIPYSYTDVVRNSVLSGANLVPLRASCLVSGKDGQKIKDTSAFRRIVWHNKHQRLLLPRSSVFGILQHEFFHFDKFSKGPLNSLPQRNSRAESRRFIIQSLIIWGEIMKGCYSSFVKINEGHNGLPMDKTKLDLSVGSSKTSWKYVWRPILRPNLVPKGMCPHCSSPEHSDYNHKHQIYCLLCKQTGHSQSLCHSRKAEVGFQIKSPIYDSFDKKI